MTTRRHEFVLIGPVCVGKTAVARVLAERLGVAHVEVDRLWPRYFRECPDFDQAAFDRMADQPFLTRYRYWERAEPYTLERVLTEHHDCVFDLGAGYTHYQQPLLRQRAARALRPFTRVVLLLPSADRAESARVLRERSRLARGTDWVHEGFDFIGHWLCDGQNEQLATRTVVTADRTPEQVAGDLLQD